MEDGTGEKDITTQSPCVYVFFYKRIAIKSTLIAWFDIQTTFSQICRRARGAVAEAAISCFAQVEIAYVGSRPNNGQEKPTTTR